MHPLLYLAGGLVVAAVANQRAAYAAGELDGDDELERGPSHGIAPGHDAGNLLLGNFLTDDDDDNCGSCGFGDNP